MTAYNFIQNMQYEQRLYHSIDMLWKSTWYALMMWYSTHSSGQETDCSLQLARRFNIAHQQSNHYSS